MCTKEISVRYSYANKHHREHQICPNVAQLYLNINFREQYSKQSFKHFHTKTAAPRVSSPSAYKLLSFEGDVYVAALVFLQLLYCVLLGVGV